MNEKGHEENRQEDRQQDLLGNSLYAFGVHGAMAQEAAVCVKEIIAANAHFPVPFHLMAYHIRVRYHSISY